MAQIPQFSGGGRYRTRTCDPLGVNGGPVLQTAIFYPTTKAISPLCAGYVLVAFNGVVQTGTPEPLGRPALCL
jgi:hypothetical protein